MLVEFVADRGTKQPLPIDRTLDIARQSVANGVMIMRAGLYSNCLRFLPPWTMPEDMLREGLDVVGRAVGAVQGRPAAAV